MVRSFEPTWRPRELRAVPGRPTAGIEGGEAVGDAYALVGTSDCVRTVSRGAYIVGEAPLSGAGWLVRDGLLSSRAVVRRVVRELRLVLQHVVSVDELSAESVNLSMQGLALVGDRLPSGRELPQEGRQLSSREGAGIWKAAHASHSPAHQRDATARDRDATARDRAFTTPAASPAPAAWRRWPLWSADP